ncbi:MAG: aminopeptidase [Hydrogenophaga sp.]|jgi:predicted aminopeptidase|nr:aminopeptidase [Hydrogenophaga sp.]
MLPAARWYARLGALALAGALGGCASTTGPGYYWQSVTGHLQVMKAARPVQHWLDDPSTPDTLKTRLATALRIRDFAATELALPDNASYRRYADLQRRAVVYNVTAAPALSLTLNTWCFPVVGCVGYRGYYAEADARAFAASLPKDLDVAVYPVPAYSTLGWMNWLGGDPLLNTFIQYPEGELARLIFHELAHQVVYVKDDTMFNESYATAVERLGGERWLSERAKAAARTEYEAFDARRRQFRALTLSVRQRLAAVYADPAQDTATGLARKAEVMQAFRVEYEALKQQWGGFAGYDAWVARANNATFATQAAYDELVPGFEALFEREGRDFDRFHAAVRQLGERPREERHAELKALSASRTAAIGNGPPTTP